ncbi:hypothetical protein LSH36_575g02054 [Paralvinella palmiformis]|uniref:Uncharacterized protein n=1 Tax=Paralvinella palmiformis TaxID=53620 RepID=A0AAD9J6K7_9ANNE|nr:hypothetical protein LSH36_575g02054 [Paralvinella palmiformis]
MIFAKSVGIRNIWDCNSVDGSYCPLCQQYVQYPLSYVGVSVIVGLSSMIHHNKPSLCRITNV